MAVVLPQERLNFFSRRIVLLRIIGCWSYEGRSERFYTLASEAVLFNSFVGVALSLYAFFMVIAQGQGIDRVCNQAVTFIIAFQVFSKSMFMLLKSHQLNRLIIQLNGSLHDNFVRKPSDMKIIRKCYGYDVKLSIFFCVFSTFVTVANILKPLIVTLSDRGIGFNETEKKFGELPSKYPFQLEATSSWYWFWFGQQVLVVLPGGIASWISDSVFCAFLYYICGYFDILMNNIRNGGSKLNLTEIARNHCQLVRYSKDTIHTLGPLMVIQLLLAAITICCLLFQFFSMSGELVQYLRPLTYLTLKFIQIYIMCWHGQLLLDKSTQIADVLYFCPWYGKSQFKSRDFKILMLCTRFPVKVLYGGIFQLSAGTFGQILNAAYGYFTLMSKMKQSNSNYRE